MLDSAVKNQSPVQKGLEGLRKLTFFYFHQKCMFLIDMIDVLIKIFKL